MVKIFKFSTVRLSRLSQWLDSSRDLFWIRFFRKEGFNYDHAQAEKNCIHWKLPAKTMWDCNFYVRFAAVREEFYRCRVLGCFDERCCRRVRIRTGSPISDQ